MFTTTRQPRVGLLALPREIREKIYDHLFQSASLTFEIHPDSLKDSASRAPFWILLPKSAFSVMLACHTLYRETSERRFAVQSWHFKNAGGLELFNRRASGARKATVRRVSGVRGDDFRSKTQLHQLPSLKEVYVGPFLLWFTMTSREDGGVGEGEADSFVRAGWDELAYSINEGGFEGVLVDKLPQSRAGRDEWDECVVSVNFVVNKSAYEVCWIPTTLDLKTKGIVKHWDQMRVIDRRREALPSPPLMSPCVGDQFESARRDLQTFKNRWKRYMEVE